MWDQLCTVLSEFGGRELCGDPERLLGAALEDEAGGDAGTAVEVFFATGQTQVESVVTEGRVLITLRPQQGSGTRRKRSKNRCQNDISFCPNM